MLAVFSGLFNATPFGESWEYMKKWVEPRAAVVEVVAPGGPGAAFAPPAAEGYADSPCGVSAPEKGVCYAPQVNHAKFKWSKALLSLAIVFAGIALSWLLSVRYYGKRDPKLVGLTSRNRLAKAGYGLLANRYYLDALYERVVVRSIVGPIARSANWFHLKILDGILHAVAAAIRGLSAVVYRRVDQGIVDGAVNASGEVMSAAGGALQPVQSGRVNMYGALLFGAAAVAALVFILIYS